MAADVHQPEAAVIAFTVGLDVVHLADPPVLDQAEERAHRRPTTVLVVGGDLDAALDAARHDRVGLLQI